MDMNLPLYLESARLVVHGKARELHRAHDPDAGGDDEEHLLIDAQPQTLRTEKVRSRAASVAK